MLLCCQVGRCKRNRKSLLEIPTHPSIAMKKMLKDLTFEKRKFKLCKCFEKSALYVIKLGTLFICHVESVYSRKGGVDIFLRTFVLWALDRG
jgi:hypothetical protein